jgi:hypothetical protein
MKVQHLPPQKGSSQKPYRKDWQTQIAWGYRAIGLVVVLLLFFGFLKTCGGVSFGALPTGSSARQIHIDKQVWVEGLDGHVKAIARSSSGGFVVAGYLGTGWAVATDAQGNALWKYVSPLDEDLVLPSPAFSHSEYHGVVPLANGNVLLCGEKYTKAHHTVASITILNGMGELIEERQEFTNEDRDYTSSSIYRCVRWNDGVAVIGSTQDGPAKSFVWLMRLDGNGAKQWQKPLDAGTVSVDSSSVADRNLVLARISISPATTAFTLAEYNDKGDVLATSAPIIGSFPYFLRPVAADQGIALLDHFDLSNTLQLHTLDGRLAQLEKPIQVAVVNFDLQEGFGYRLPDHSLLLFGRTATQSGDRGSIEWIGKRGEYLTLSGFPQILQSLTFGDAIPIANNQFVVAAAQNAYVSRTHGLFLTWISLK